MLCANGGAQKCLQDRLIRFLAPPSLTAHKRSNSARYLSPPSSRRRSSKSSPVSKRISPRVSTTELGGSSSQARRSGWRKRLSEQAGTTSGSSTLSFQLHPAVNVHIYRPLHISVKVFLSRIFLSHLSLVYCGCTRAISEGKSRTTVLFRATLLTRSSHDTLHYTRTSHSHTIATFSFSPSSPFISNWVVPIR